MLIADEVEFERIMAIRRRAGETLLKIKSLSVQVLLVETSGVRKAWICKVWAHYRLTSPIANLLNE